MSNKLHETEVLVSEKDRSTIKKILLNHIGIYNYALDTLQKNPDYGLPQLNWRANRFAKDNNIEPILITAIHNELYYLYRKFSRNVRGKKRLSDIQYLTLSNTNLDNSRFCMSEDGKTFLIKEHDIVLELVEPYIHEPMEKEHLYYFNISYSSSEDKFQLTAYRS